MFARTSEAEISRAILREFSRWLDDYIVSDVVIVGGGPSGLLAARDLAAAGVKTLLLERNNYLGGGFWVGGYLMNTLTFRSPAQEILKELDIPFKTVSDGLHVADGPHACSRLILAACEAGAKILNMTGFDDVVLRNGRVEGAVINWAAVAALPRQITCVDPISVECKILIDATGHDALVLESLRKRGLLQLKGIGAMDADSSEALVVEKTGEIFPGVIAAGMAVSAAYGVPRMGPTFAGMLYSGKKAAQEAMRMLQAKPHSQPKRKSATVNA
jgi:sulfide-dependent adenosine diphosphate thiazole synthase